MTLINNIEILLRNVKRVHFDIKRHQSLRLSVLSFFLITFVNPIRHSVINGVKHTGVRYSSNAASIGEHLIIDIILVNINQSVPRGRPLDQGYAIAIRDLRVRAIRE